MAADEFARTQDGAPGTLPDGEVSLVARDERHRGGKGDLEKWSTIKVRSHPGAPEHIDVLRQNAVIHDHVKRTRAGHVYEPAGRASRLRLWD